MRKACTQCGEEFEALHSNYKTCSRKCASRWRNYLRTTRPEKSNKTGKYSKEPRPGDGDFYDHKLADDRFCKAMIKAGYEQTGADKRPCTTNPQYIKPPLGARITTNMAGWDEF